MIRMTPIHLNQRRTNSHHMIKLRSHHSSLPNITHNRKSQNIHVNTLPPPNTNINPQIQKTP